MKILHLIIFTLVAIIVVSCYNVNEPCVYAKDFFPLRVGDRFVYRYSLEESFSNTLHALEHEVRVAGTIDIDEKTYYVIENFFSILDYYDTIVYARNEGNNIYFFDGVKDILCYRFNPSLNSEYPIPFLTLPNGTGNPATIKKISCSSNHFTFLIHILTPDNVHHENYKWYITFERGKGVTKGVNQYIIDNELFENIVYDLVNVYREE